MMKKELDSAGVSLTSRTFYGIAWNALGSLLRYGIALGSSIVVARLLTPRDYAIAGLAAAVAGIFNAASAGGFATALVRERQLNTAKCHSIFWFLLVVAVGLATLMAAFSPLAARFYGEAALLKVIPVFSVLLIVNMAGSVPDAIVTRDMRFRQQNTISVISALVAAPLAVGLALVGFGYWALIVPSAGGGLALALGSFWVSGYRPRLIFSWSEVRSVSKFGTSMLGSQLLNYFANNSDYLIMGRYWSKMDFGLYYFAYERSRQPFYILQGQVGAVGYSAFSEIQDDLTRMRRAYLRGTRMMLFLVSPLYILLVGLADPLIPWIFGSQWQPAVPVFRVFAVFCIVQAFGAFASAPLLALNHAPFALGFNLFRVAVTVPCLIGLGLYGADILTTSIVLLGIWCVQSPFFVGFLYWKIHLGWHDFWTAFGRVLLATAVMAGGMAATCQWAESMHCTSWVTVLAAATVSCGAFALVTLPVMGEMFDLIHTALRER